jgi:hypothetical protein
MFQHGRSRRMDSQGGERKISDMVTMQCSIYRFMHDKGVMMWQKYYCILERDGTV